MHTHPAYSNDELRSLPDNIFAPLRTRIDELVAQLPDLQQLEDRLDDSKVIFTPAFIQPDIMIGFFKWYFDNLSPERMASMQLETALASNAHALKAPMNRFALSDNFKFHDAGAHPLTEQEHREAWDFLLYKAPALVGGMALISNAIITYFAAAKIQVVDKYISAALGVEQASEDQINRFDVADRFLTSEMTNPDSDDVRLKKYQAQKIQHACSVAQRNASLDSMVHEYLPFIIHPAAQSEEGVTPLNLRKGIRDGFVKASVFESARWYELFSYQLYQDPDFVKTVETVRHKIDLPRVAHCPFKKTIGFLMNTGVSVKDGREFVMEPNAGSAAMLLFTTRLYRGYRQSALSQNPSALAVDRRALD